MNALRLPFLTNEVEDFWTEVKLILGNSSNISNVIHGCPASDEFANCLALKYQELNTCVPYNADEICDISARLLTVGYGRSFC
jgi:hypothetical protein